MKQLDGQQLSTTIYKELKQAVDKLKGKGAVPTIAFILIGDNPASHIYVRIKKKRCQEVGIQSKTVALPSTVSEKELIAHIQMLNSDLSIDGILVQHPLPEHIQAEEIFEEVDPTKDVDGFHPLNLGKLLTGQKSGFTPCTPLGIVKLLDANQINIEGCHAVIVGRSTIVGKPLAALLSEKQAKRNATVTLAHSSTRSLKELCKSADLLIIAIGQPRLIGKEMIKPGAVVIDVGINRVLKEQGGYELVGDVAFDQVAPLCSAITPVPGGVGPMTVAMLLSNALKSFFKRHSKGPFPT